MARHKWTSIKEMPEWDDAVDTWYTSYCPSCYAIRLNTAAFQAPAHNTSPPYGKCNPDIDFKESLANIPKIIAGHKKKR